MLKQFDIVYEMLINLFIPAKERILHFDEIQFTITIPKGLRVLSKKQIIKRAKKKSMNSVVAHLNIANDSDCIPLLFAFNAEKNFMAGFIISLKNRPQKEAEQYYYNYLNAQWDRFNKKNKNFSRVYCERKSTNEVISNVLFEKDEILKKIPERTLASIYSYHSFHKNYEIFISAAFINQEFGIKILKSIEDSVFTF